MSRETALKKYSVRISGHSTSVTLEPPFWDALCDIAQSRALSMNSLISEIDEKRAENNLSGACRLYVLKYLQDSIA